MSTVKLSVFAAFKRRPKKAPTPGVDVVFGAKGFRINEQGLAELETASVPLAEGLTPPVGGLLMLYGLRDLTDELQRRRAEARAVGAAFQYAEFEVEVGDIVVGIIDKETLPGCRFANVKRMSIGIQQDIMDCFVEYIREEGGEPDVTMNRIKAIARRPDLFGRLLSENPDYQRLEVLIIPVEESGQVRQVAYVRDNCKYIALRQSQDDEILYLPENFGEQVEPQPA